MVYFDGQTYDAAHDRDRLAEQLGKVRSVMLDGAWRTLAGLAEVVGAPEASVSARLRDLRKPRFGSYAVERRYRGDLRRGLHEYRIVGSGSVPTVAKPSRASRRMAVCPRCGGAMARPRKAPVAAPVSKQSLLIYDEAES